MEIEAGRLLQEHTRALESANEALRQNQQKLAAELDAAERLQNVATQLIRTRGTTELYEQILDTAKAILHADFASIQQFYPERGDGELLLLGHRGFSEEAAKRWQWVCSATQTTCGEALRTRQRVVVPDVRLCGFIAGSDDLNGYLDAKIHAAQSTPLLSRSSNLMGMMSTYWREPHELSASELRTLDVLARMAADLMEGRRLVEKQGESEERFRLAIKATNDAIWDIDLETGIVTWNETYSAVYGRPAETSDSWQWWIDRIHPEDRERTVSALRAAISSNTSSWTCEYRFQRADSNFAYIYDRAYIGRNESGKARRVIGAMQDLTERKRAEDALRESQQHLVSIYNTVEDVIFHVAVEPEGQFRFISVNAAFLRVTGLSREKVVGKTVNEVIPEPSLTIVLGKYRQAIEENTVVHWEETSDYPAGRLTGEVRIAPVFDKKGSCTHLVGSVHDITEVKRAREIEDRLASDLETSRDQIRALAASLMKAQEDERRRVSCELHDQICHQLASLARDIDKITVGPVPYPENTRVQLEAIRARVVKTSQETHDIAYQMRTAILDDLGLVASLKDLCSQFSERCPDIAVAFEDSGPTDSISREVSTCLYRIAEESLENIAKHSRAKGVSVRLGFKKRAVVLTIHDDGAGFDPKTVKGQGGLGLVSMEERARSVQGRLTITSQPGHGTQITLEIRMRVGNS